MLSNSWFKNYSDLWLPRSIQAFEDLDVQFLPFKDLAKADEMIHYVGESFLHIRDCFPLSILNISYSWIRACFLALFTLVVPTWVTSRMSIIYFPEVHCKNLKNSSEFKAEVMMFLRPFSPLWPRFFNENIILFKFRNKRPIYNNIPDSSIIRFNKDFHSNLPKLIVQSTKQRWPVYWSILPKG